MGCSNVVSPGPINHGPCVRSGLPRLFAWLLGLQAQSSVYSVKCLEKMQKNILKY